MLIRCVILFVLLCIVVRTIQHTTKNASEALCDYCEVWENYDLMKYWHVILKEDCIVPHEMTIAPNVCITGLYNLSGTKVMPGGIISKSEMQNIPNLTWPVENNTYYTLIMTHLNPLNNISKKAYKHWQHWLVINIPGNKVEEGETISEYKIPIKPARIGIHRHLFWVFKQRHLITFTARQRWWYGSGRMDFKVWNFAKKYHLTGPVAILHFSSWDHAEG